jgi:uncharacterized protein
MSVVLDTTAAPKIRWGHIPAFHLRMACGTLALLIVTVVGCRLTSIHTDVSVYAVAIFAALAMIAPLPIYWHERGRIGLRESALVIPWELLMAAMLPFPVLIAARLHLPLQDSLFGHIDQALGVSVPGIVRWADHHWLGTVIGSSYPLLQPLTAVAALAPALAGKVRHARQFLLANLVAFAIGVPAFGLLPAVGPWFYYHLPPNSAQAYCWSPTSVAAAFRKFCVSISGGRRRLFSLLPRSVGNSRRGCAVGISTASSSCGIAFGDDHRLYVNNWLALFQRCAGRYRGGRTLIGDCESLCCIGRNKWVFMNLIDRITGQFSPSGTAKPNPRLRIWNLTRQVALAECVEVADHGPARRKGLLGRDGLPDAEGLWIVPCESVHTFWMKFPIDLVYLDRSKKVKKVRSGVPPWRLSACLSAHSVLEFASGTVNRTQTKPGDRLEFFPVDSPNATIAGHAEEAK